MAKWPGEIESAYQDWVQDLTRNQNGRVLRERQCVHHGEGAEGEHYRGTDYLQALQRLRGETAMRMATRVSPFFWSDAPFTWVWLCRECSREIGLTTKPPG